MIKKLLYVGIIILTTLSYQITNSYDKELSIIDEWKTIKELKESIDFLDKANSDLDEDFKSLDIDYEVKKFLRTNLSNSDLSNIKYLISVFNSSKFKLETEIANKTKNKLSVTEDKKALIEEKRKFYNWLIPYINSQYNDKYLEYIKYDIQIFSKQKNSSNDIESKKEILNNKVVTLETKIQEHRNYINENVSKIIESKLDEKLKNLANNDTFRWLSSESKVKVLNKTIDKITQKLEKIKNLNSTSTWTVSKYSNELFDKKVQTFLIAVNKLEIFRDSFK